jgi:hypothetical protein
VLGLLAPLRAKPARDGAGQRTSGPRRCILAAGTIQTRAMRFESSVRPGNVQRRAMPSASRHRVPRPRRTPWLAAALCAWLVVACGSAPPPGPAVPVAQQEALAERVTRWVLGEEQRMVRRKTRAAARLLVLPRQGAARPLLDRCVRASSLLPSRTQPGKSFLIVDGALHVFDAGAAHAGLVPVALEPGGLALTRLVASSKQEPPAELLVLVQPAGKGREEALPRLWRLVVSGERARGEPVEEAPWLQSRAAFFARYHAPRCREDGSDCLVIVDGDSGAFLDVQPQPRAPRHEWKALEGGHVHDAAWNPASLGSPGNPGDQGSALALVTCDEKTP